MGQNAEATDAGRGMGAADGVRTVEREFKITGAGDVVYSDFVRGDGPVEPLDLNADWEGLHDETLLVDSEQIMRSFFVACSQRSGFIRGVLHV